MLTLVVRCLCDDEVSAYERAFVIALKPGILLFDHVAMEPGPLKFAVAVCVSFATYVLGLALPLLIGHLVWPPRH